MPTITPTTTAAPNPTVSPAAAQNTYTVKAGDTANRIAQSLGYKNYVEAGITGFSSGNPDLIRPGEVLTYKPKTVAPPAVVTSKEGNTQMTNATGAITANDNATRIIGTQYNPDGSKTTTYADGHVSTTPPAPGPNMTSGSNGGLTGAQAGYQDQNQYDQNGNPLPKTPAQLIQENMDSATNAWNLYSKQVDSIQSGNLTPAEQQQLDAVKDQFEQTKALQTHLNANYTGGVTELGIRQGRNRYAPEIAMSEINDSISTGIAKIAEIQSKETQALSTMRQAMLDGDFKRVSDLYSSYSNFISEKNKSINDLAGLSQKAQQLVLDEWKANQTTDTINYNAAVQQGYQGSFTQFQEDMKGTNSTELIKNYNFAKADGYTGSFMAYQQAAKVAKAASSNSKGALTADDVARYGLPESLIGKSEYSIIQDVALKHVPEWFTQMLAETEPGKEFSKEGLQDVWKNFRESDDIKVFSHLMDINKAQTGTIQEGDSTGDIDFTKPPTQ